MDDSAVSFVHGFQPPGSLSTSNRCWCLRRFPQRHSSSPACCQQKHCRSASAGGFVRFWLPFRETVDVVFSQRSRQLKLAQRCNNFGHVCSFSGQPHQCWKGHYPSGSPTSISKIYSLVGLNHGKVHRWSGSGMQCAVVLAESCSTSAIVS